MMREVTFSRNDIQRETSMSRVYEWFQEKLKVREQIRDRMGLPSNKVDNGEKNVSKVSRRERYESKHSERPYSAAATTRSRSTVRKTAENSSRIIGRGKNRLQRPSTAPFSTHSNDPDDDIKLTGRLQTGGFRMRNLFASQRKRILKSTTMKRAEQRRMIGQITDAAEAHAADVEESANMYSYLVGGTATTKKSMARPRTAGGSRARAKGSADESKRIRPTTASSTSIVQRSGSSRPNTNVYDYPTVEQKNDNVKMIEREQWLEERWLKGRADEAADERYKREVDAAMQQWAMNRGRIEEEIARRQESRRYASRSGRYYNNNIFQQRPKSAAASISRRSRPSSASTGIRTVAQQRPVSAAGSLRSPANSQQQVG